jgi:hypothetical protein
MSLEMDTKLQTFNCSLGNSSIYEGLYEIRFSKLIGIFISIANIVILCPTIYFVIWYEKFGSNDNFRSLVNQFVSSGCWTALIYNILVQTTEIGIALIGSVGKTFCYLHTLVKIALVIQYTWQATSISFVKYLYIFVLKNPSGQNDDFWCFFINMSIAFLAILSQFVFLNMPGKNPYFYYVCTGEDPTSLREPKINYSLYSSFLIFIFLFFFVLMKKNVYNSEEVFPNTSHQTSHKNNPMPSTIGNIAKTMLASFGTLATTLFVVIPIMIISLILNATPTEKLSHNPYYHFIQFHSHICPLIGTGLLAISYYSTNAKLRSVAGRKLRELFLNEA